MPWAESNLKVVTCKPKALFSYVRLQIRNTKHEARNKFKFSNDQILRIWICFETGDPPEGWGVRRTNFDIRISDLITVLNQ